MANARPTVFALVVAAGRGSRAGGPVPKQYQTLAGRAILAHTLQPFLDEPAIDAVAVVIHPDDAGHYHAAVPDHPKLRPPVPGGGERQESVRNGLAGLGAEPTDFVLIHDAVRPFASRALLRGVVEALATEDAILPALPVTDTLKRADSAGHVEATVPRAGLYGAQTPQGFRFGPIMKAHARAAGSSAAFTDDASIAEWAGVPVRIVPGEAGNVKLTTADDIAMAELRLSAHETRVGTGYDVHALGPGDGVMLGGVAIPFGQSLVGHSDADVALHALTDSVLGAIADGDIGSHFPPSDPQWRGAASERFLAHAVERLAARRGAIVHLDLTLIAEAPKIGPHRDAMRQRIAAICGIDPGRVAIKATTNEKMGFVGRGEGIAALATATVRLPAGAP
ncbi:MAG: bifunctional 2-C-methyl-D-erythritol 4-phosphate cytidylyltransferase/2-C-methyl-D-erythritol 2,4-cyclodiphosphate synthase [Bauldia sp.]|nr:bifunctional 2-C-methyl-D-erythritol 4-phosphate cytidylyltransferase/2-C-methyl-D-erythritol 2,4-cyclodiphosphate synthase [Bauldia sp.]